jgi:hypothetical protein
LVVGDYGYRKAIDLKADSTYLASILTLRWVVVRPNRTRIIRDLVQGDRDANGNFTWLVQQSDLPIAGRYRCQAFDVTVGRQIGTYISEFEVIKPL